MIGTKYLVLVKNDHILFHVEHLLVREQAEWAGLPG